MNIVVSQAKEFHGMKTIGKHFHVKLYGDGCAEDSTDIAELTRSVGMAVIRGNDVISVIRRKNIDNSYDV